MSYLAINIINMYKKLHFIVLIYIPLCSFMKMQKMSVSYANHQFIFYNLASYVNAISSLCASSL